MCSRQWVAVPLYVHAPVISTIWTSTTPLLTGAKLGSSHRSMSSAFFSTGSFASTIECSRHPVTSTARRRVQPPKHSLVTLATRDPAEPCKLVAYACEPRQARCVPAGKYFLAARVSADDGAVGSSGFSNPDLSISACDPWSANVCHSPSEPLSLSYLNDGSPANFILFD